MRIAVLGASGLVGRHLVAALHARGDEVATSSLRDIEAAARACEGTDAVVNLAGEPVAERWTPANKEAIRRTRTELPRALLERLAGSAAKPAAFISASAVGYYGTSETETFVESSPPGDDFLARVCIEWEREANRAREFGMRVAIVRTGFVLATEGGALAKLLIPFRLGLGGPAGSGRQWVSWIHIDDLIGIYLRAIDDGSETYNATAPTPVTNATFSRALGAALHRPAFLPAPPFALTALFGEGATIVLDGQRVLPERTLATGYAFRYPELDGALRALLS